MSLPNTMSTFCSEFFLLLVMIIGLVRQRDHYIGRLLLKQVATHTSGSMLVNSADWVRLS